MSDWRGKWILAAVIIVLAAVYCVGNYRVQLWDRDEPRNAEAARQMLESGDWVVPRFLDQVRIAKPVFTYWCQVIAMKGLGENAFAARLPSVVGMTLTLVVLAIVLFKAVGRLHALWTVTILGTAGMVIAWCARNALTDGVLLLWITIAQLCFYRVYESRRVGWITVIIWSAAVGLAGLTKGPVILAVQGATLVCLFAIDVWNRRKGRSQPATATQASPLQVVLKIVVALIIVAAIVGPWIYLVEKRSPGFILASTIQNVFRRMTEPLEQHKGPPGYYFLTIWGTFFPWSLFLPMAMIFAWRHRSDAKIRFAFAAVVGPWIFFEFVRTKLPHYVLPCFVPLAYLTADALVRCFRREEDDLVRPSFLIGAAIWAVAVLLIGLAPWLAVRQFMPIPLAATIAWTVVAIAYAAIVFTLFVAERPRGAVAAIAGGMVVAMIVAFAWYLPSAWWFRLSANVGAGLRKDGAVVPGRVQMIGYKEPSLAFYQGGTIREQSENDYLLTHWAEDWPQWLAIRSDIWQRMPESVHDRFMILGTYRGWAYADKGKVVDVLVVRKK